MDYVKAFVVGGLICVLVQILMEKTKLMPGRIMVLLVCTGAVLVLWDYISHLRTGQAPERQCRFWALAMYCGRA